MSRRWKEETKQKSLRRGKKLGRDLRAFRKLKGLSQIEAARKIGISCSTVNRVECGREHATKPSLDKIQWFLSGQRKSKATRPYRYRPSLLKQRSARIKALGARLKQYRAETHLSQREVAKKLGLSYSVISRLERGDRKLSSEEVLGKVSQYLRNGKVKLGVTTSRASAQVQPDAREFAIPLGEHHSGQISFNCPVNIRWDGTAVYVKAKGKKAGAGRAQVTVTDVE